MVAREVRALGQGGAVGARLVERLEHEVDELTQAIGHRKHILADTALIGSTSCWTRRAPACTVPSMASWTEFETAAPDLAAAVRERLDAHKHKTLATIRRDGAPRISGTETAFVDGELWIGSMWQARKARDLQRDPRFALHSGSDEPSEWRGDAKLAGVAEEITDTARVREINGEPSGDEPSHLFRLDLREVSTVGLDEGRTLLVIEVWTPEGGVRTITRK